MRNKDKTSNKKWQVSEWYFNKSTKKSTCVTLNVNDYENYINSRGYKNTQAVIFDF